MLSNKAKIVSSVLGTFILSSSLSAEVKFSGTAELDLFYRTNQVESSPGSNNFRGAPNEEIAIVANVDGTHEGNEVIKTFKWRLASKVATDVRYDSLGIREAWIGGVTDFGEFRAGNQFSNLYLIEDYPYGNSGSGNVWADFGAHEVQYGRGISYFSPNLAGFTLALQYDLGAKKQYNDPNSGDIKILSSYATEALITYDSKYVRLDAAYYRGVNSGNMNSESDVFGGSKSNMSEGLATAENKAEEFYLGSIIKLSDFKVYLGYSHNHWSGDTTEYMGEDTRVNKALIKGEYTFLTKHTVGLGYQKVFDSRVLYEGAGSAVTNNDAMDVYNAQYAYAINTNVSTFLQARYHAVGDNASVMDYEYQLDGKHKNAKNVARILLGAFMTF